LTPPALERRDRDGLDAALAVAEAADGPAEGGRDLANPLREKDTGRHQRDRGSSRACHGRDGDARLAGARREHHDTPPARRLPGPERGVLVRAESRLRPGLRHVRPAVHLVREVDRASHELLPDRGVVPRRSAERANTRIPQNPR
jgi:hypothetical protein